MQIQRELEELLLVKCDTEPSSADILLRAGFESGNFDLVLLLKLRSLKLKSL